MADELPDDVYYLVLKDAEGNETKLAMTGEQAMALAAGERGVAWWPNSPPASMEVDEHGDPVEIHDVRPARVREDAEDQD